MGFLVRMGLLAGAGAVLYKMFRSTADTQDTADQAPVHSSGIVRNAGTNEQHYMDDDGPWDKVDQQVDESFPASDPPSNY